MKKYSLHALIFCIFVALIIISSISIYLSVTRHHQRLMETAIEEKIRVAEAVSKTISSPIWRLRAAMFPGISLTFIEEMAKTKDVTFIRLVNSDGSIELSNIKEEWGETLDSDLVKVIKTGTPIVRDEVYNGEKIKTIIYPSYENKTVWVAFFIKSIEEATKNLLIQDILITLGMIILLFLILFLALRNIVHPLKKMEAVCKEIGKGNLDVKMEVVPLVEIDRVVTTLNEMIKDLRESHAALEESRAVLEIKVAARTKELQELVESREEEIKQRTRELQRKVEELEKFHRLAVGRELKMIELKEEIKKLKKELEKVKK